MSPTGGDRQGTVLRVQRLCVHDGPGIRTTLFLKGCAMRCVVCHNPESWRAEPDLSVSAARCAGLGRCLAACPRGVFAVDAAGRRQVRRERCDACGRCAGECWSGAIGILGRRVTAREAAARLLRDAPFFRTSGGGVTISGGEPLLQPEFTRAVLEEARRAGVHAAVETAGFAGPGAAREVAAACDLVLFDLKHADPGAHRLWTGVDNAAILRNLEYLSTAGPELIVRVTVVPGFNADRASVDAIGRLLAGLPRRPRVELLPVHRLAAAKYRNLGLPFRGTAVRSPAPGLLRDVAGRLADFGLDVPPRRLPEAA